MISKTESKYKNWSTDRSCGFCDFFEEPDKCKKVSGKISTHGTCKIWGDLCCLCDDFFKDPEECIKVYGKINISKTCRFWRD